MCSQVLELLVLQRSHRTALFASCLQAVDEGYDAHAVVPTLSGASSLQLAAFFEEERLHVKEGVVVIDEDYSSRKTASISTEARGALSLSLSLRPSPSLPLSPSPSRSRSLAPTLPPNQARLECGVAHTHGGCEGAWLRSNPSLQPCATSL